MGMGWAWVLHHGVLQPKAWPQRAGDTQQLHLLALLHVGTGARLDPSRAAPMWEPRAQEQEQDLGSPRSW